MRSRWVLLLTIAFAAGAADWHERKAEGDRKYNTGDYEAAFGEYSAALASVSPESVEAAGLQLDLSRVWWLRGDYRRARELDEQALVIFRRAYGEEHPAIARALAGIGLAVQGEGDYAAAQPYFEQALQVSRRTNGNEAAGTVDVLQKLAFNLSRSGDYGRSRVIAEEAVAIAERSLGPGDPLTVQGLRTLGQILNELGDSPGAQRVMLRSLALAETRAGKDGLEVGDLLVSIGNSAKDVGLLKNAEGYYLRAAAIYEQHLGPRNTKVGGALDNLGQNYLLMGRLEDARKVLRRALDIQTSELGPRHPWTGNVIQGLAKVEAAAGNYPSARELFESNLEIWREVLGPSHPFTVVSLTLLADVMAHLGRYADALELALEAAAIRRDDIAFTVRSVDEREALRYADLHATSMDTALTLAARSGTSPADRRRVWDALIRSRALVLDEMGARHRTIHRSGSAEMTGLAERVSASRSRIAKVVLQGRRGMSPKAYAAAVEKARSELEGMELELAQKSLEFRREVRERNAGYDQVREAMPAGTALVAFRRYTSLNHDLPGGVATESYVAFVMAGSDREPVAVPLGPASRVESLVKAWRAEIDRERRSLGRAARANEQHYRSAARALKAAVWDPVARRTGTAGKVYLVPDGALQLVNFAALPAANGTYLIESGPLLHILSAERDLTAPVPGASGRELLAVSDPAFAGPAGRSGTQYRGGHSTCGDFASLQFDALPGSTEEVRSILGIWERRGWHSIALSGTEATESAVKQQAGGKRVVHLATHGFFLDGHCPGPGVARENPLLRAGLALSGANRRTVVERNEEDGVLTAEEAASLDLEGAEWVVLSGCDTGVGDVQAGEGVLGLRRAFLEAGARTLIASLWPVGDEDARQWMTRLYRARFMEGRSTMESVRDAGLKQLRAIRRTGKSTHPFYWAGFIAVGDWR